MDYGFQELPRRDRWAEKRAEEKRGEAVALDRYATRDERIAWVYGVVKRPQATPLALALLFHLACSDDPAKRSSKGCARALSRHQTSTKNALLSLGAAGLIRRVPGSHVWELGLEAARREAASGGEV